MQKSFLFFKQKAEDNNAVRTSGIPYKQNKNNKGKKTVYKGEQGKQNEMTKGFSVLQLCENNTQKRNLKQELVNVLLCVYPRY